MQLRLFLRRQIDFNNLYSIITVFEIVLLTNSSNLLLADVHPIAMQCMLLVSGIHTVCCMVIFMGKQHKYLININALYYLKDSMAVGHK